MTIIRDKDGKPVRIEVAGERPYADATEDVLKAVAELEPREKLTSDGVNEAEYLANLDENMDAYVDIVFGASKKVLADRAAETQRAAERGMLTEGQGIEEFFVDNGLADFDKEKTK